LHGDGKISVYLVLAAKDCFLQALDNLSGAPHYFGGIGSDGKKEGRFQKCVKGKLNLLE